MRFITQFEISPDEWHRMSEDYRKRKVEYLKQQQSKDVGILIGNTFGLKEDSYFPLRWGMEFQAFKMDDWQNFKENLSQWMLTMNSLGMNNLSEIFLTKLFKEIEEK